MLHKSSFLLLLLLLFNEFHFTAVTRGNSWVQKNWFPLSGFVSVLLAVFHVAGCQSALPPNQFQKCLTFVILTTVCLHLPLSPLPPLSLSLSLFDSDVRGAPRLCRFFGEGPSIGKKGKVKFPLLPLSRSVCFPFCSPSLAPARQPPPLDEKTSAEYQTPL